MEEKDKLSEYFKKHLEDNTPDSSWNVPGDHIFESAIEQLPTKANYRRFIPLLAFFLLASTIITLGVMQSNNHSKVTHTLTQKINTLDGKLNEANKKNVKLENNIVAQTATIKAIEKENEALKAVLNQIGKEQRTFSLPSNTVNVKEQFSNNDLKTEEYTKNTSRLLDAKTVETLPFKQISDSDSRIKVSATKIPYLTARIKSSQASLGTYYINEDLAIVEKEKEKRNWSYSIGLINNLSWLTMTDVPANSEDALTQYDKTHGCYGFKIGSEYKAGKKWGIYGDLSYNQYQNRSTLKTDLFYDESNEIGEMVELDLDIMNPFGSYSSPASFRVDSDLNQNDLMTEKANIRQHLSTISLNLGATYNLLKLNKLSFAIGGGIGLSKTIELKNEFDISLLHNNELKVKYLDENNKVKGVKSHFIQGEVKALLDYKLSESSGIYLEGGYLRSLNSLRDSWPASGPKTYLHSVNISTGLKLSF